MCHLQATFLHTVPPIAIQLAKHPLMARYDMSSVHSVTCGAAPLGKDQAEELMERLKINAVRQGILLFMIFFRDVLQWYGAIHAIALQPGIPGTV